MKIAVLVNKENDDPLWPVWIEYYSKHVDAIETIRLRENNPTYAPGAFAREASIKQAQLLKAFDVVVYADIDEFLIPDPKIYAGLRDYIEKNWDKLPVATGYQLVQNIAAEAEIRLDYPIIRVQRHFWAREEIYDKRLITHAPVTWSPGFHYLQGQISPDPDPELILLHVLYCDSQLALKRLRVTYPQRSMTQVLEKINSYELSVIPERFKIL